MGQFSWFTQDTNHRIVNDEPHTIYMTDNAGHSYREDCYEGYGVFGGKDFYVLLAEMNGLTGTDEEDLRHKGIKLAFENNDYGENPNIIYPSLTEQEGVYYGGRWPDTDPNQGFRDEYCQYEDEDEDEYYDDYDY